MGEMSIHHQVVFASHPINSNLSSVPSWLQALKSHPIECHILERVSKSANCLSMRQLMSAVENCPFLANDFS
jgi:hypothetical protein